MCLYVCVCLSVCVCVYVYVCVRASVCAQMVTGVVCRCVCMLVRVKRVSLGVGGFAGVGCVYARACEACKFGCGWVGE